MSTTETATARPRLSFDESSAVTRLATDRFAADLSPAWASLVGIHGGYCAAIATRAISTAVGDSSRAVRSVSTQFVSAPKPGAATIDVTLERAGRTATFARARLTQDGALRLLMSAVFASDRPGAGYDDRPRPAGVPATPPDGLGRIAPPPEALRPDRVSHFDNSELVLDPETVPFASQGRSRLAGWLRPLDGEPVSAEWMVCAMDFFPPAVFSRLDRPVPAATVDFTVHLLVSDLAAAVPAGAHVYAEMESTASAGGYTVESGRMWAPDGTTVATSHQFRLAGG